MIGTGIDVRVKIQDIVSSQLPSYIISEAPLTDDFLKQFYISQEAMGGSVDLASNLDQYLDLNTLSSESIYGEFELTQDVGVEDTVVYVDSTKSFPNEWGLLKVDDEIMTYTGITTNSFTGVVRGFSAITEYNKEGTGGELVFERTTATTHSVGSDVENLSTLFLREFYKKIKYTFAPGFENLDVDSDLNVGNWIRQVRTFFQSKGSEESIKILFKVLYGEEPTVVDLEKFLIKPSDADYSRRDYAIGIPVSGNPVNLKGRSVYQSTSTDVFGAVSEIEPFTRDGQLYYRIYFFVSNDEISNERKLFKIPGRTFAHRGWTPGDTTLTVDTTIGFRDNGRFLTEDGTVFNYEQKTVNQFLGVTCEDPEKIISTKDAIVDDIEIVGTSVDGEEIRLRLTGVVFDIGFDGDALFSTIGEKISVDSLGENIVSQIVTRNELTVPQVIANSFIYNTSVRFEVTSVSGSSFLLAAPYLDKTSLAPGDKVTFLQRGSQVIYGEGRVVTSVDYVNAQVTVDDSFDIPVDQLLDIRREQKYATSTGTPIDYGDNAVLTNVLNLYDATRFDNNFYVATNSLPSYEITANIVEGSITNPTSTNYEDLVTFDTRYATLVFDAEVSFFTGDLITYSFVGDDAEPILTPGEYYVEVLSDRRKIRLYVSPSFIGSENVAPLTPTTAPGEHFFTLESQNTRSIDTKRVFRKIPALDTLRSIERTPVETKPGVVALLTNGVEVISYKSPNKVYIGPIKEINPVAGGEGYSVTSPPELRIEDPNVQITDGSPPPVVPTKASATPVVTGKLERIYIDPQNFDVDEVFSITVKGGNSGGATAEPIIDRQVRAITFDTRLTQIGGGVNFIEDSITFQANHNLPEGEAIIYDNRGFESIGISNDLNQLSTGTRLANGGVYYAKPITPRSIQLYDSLEKLRANDPPVNLTSNLNGFGIQAFETLPKNRIIGANIIEDGGIFEYRNMHFSPENVFTAYDEIRYKHHGFRNGELVEYATTGTAIGGMSTTNQYYVYKVDDSTIKLSDAGIGGTITTNFEREDFVNMTSAGVGTHSIKYSDITTEVVVSYASTIQGEIVATPVIRGEISQVYTDEGGYYGSDIVDFQKNPKIEPIMGEGARIKPVVVDGVISSVQILSRGRFYSDAPDVLVIDSSGSGDGAVLRAIIEDGEVQDVIIINGGISYGETTTTARVVEPGKDAIILPRIRDLTINLASRFGFEILLNNNYRIASYDRTIREDVYSDFGNIHSPIIGWANDGNPIYGGFGLSDAEDFNSGFRALKTGYDLNPDAIYGRPSVLNYPPGFFIDDFQFTDNGDLDEYNGRYCRTPEFPNGVYAYFAGISTDTQSLARDPQFPYFIGDSFRDSPLDESTNVDQSFDLTGKKIYRNTFPYYVGSPVAGSEFMVQSYLFDNQDGVVTDTRPGRVDSIEVVGIGQSYKIGDIPVFDSTEDNLVSFVSEIRGKDIETIEEDILSYSKTVTKVIKKDSKIIRVYVDSYHEYEDKDTVIISGLSTFTSTIAGPHVIRIDDSEMTLFAPLSPTPTGEEVVDIFVNAITPNVSVGSSLMIGNPGEPLETVEVLNIFPVNKALRIYRPVPYTVDNRRATPVKVVSDYFEIKDNTTDFFKSELDESYFFNPKQTIGVGANPGEVVAKTYSIGNIDYELSIPTQSIYAPSHGFKHLEKVLFSKQPGADIIRAADTEGGSPFVIPATGDEQELFVSNISKDYIGLKLDPEGEDLYFLSDGDPLVDDEFRYNIKSLRFAETANLDRINARVTTAEDHALKNNDKVTIEVISSGTSGVGSNPSVIVEFDEVTQSLIIDPKFVNPSGIDIPNNLILLDDHDYKLGDHLLYENYGTSIAGLETHGKYFVIPFDSDSFYLAETFIDIKPGSENPVELGSVGVGSHKFSKINPPIEIVRNRNILFDISHPSLLDMELDFYYDQGLTEVFHNNDIDRDFVVSGIDTAGLPNGKKIVEFSENNPEVIYYGLSKGGYISTADTDTIENNSIRYVDSTYKITQRVDVETNRTFLVSLPEKPEVDLYDTVVATMNYGTSSRNATGGIAKVQVISSGNNFSTLPEFITVDSDTGNSATLKANSNDIGRIAAFKFQNPGWGYSADDTLDPKGVVQSTNEFTDSDFVTAINVVSGGSGYQTEPGGVLVDALTRKVIDNGLLTVNIQSSTVVSVDIEVAPSGLSKNPQEFFTIDNSNGIPILSIPYVDETYQTGIGTFIIQTPLLGYGEAPFEVGDRVFIENILTPPGQESYLNSGDYGYRFFDVIKVINTNPIQVTVQYPEEIKSLVGYAFTSQRSFSSMVNSKIYPTFTVDQATAVFIVGERLSFIDIEGNAVATDLIVEESNTNFFKVKGTYDVLVGDSFSGAISGVNVTVTKVDSQGCRFSVGSISRVDVGWSNQTGFINEEFQVTPDNDYYQNLSYSVKSEVNFEDLIGPLNRLAHPSGLKNFSDTKIESVGSVGFARTAIDTNSTITLDFIGLTDVADTPLRVDRINVFDLGYDDNVDNNRSNAIRFNSKTPDKRLTDFIEVGTNRVLMVDDIANLFIDDDNISSQLGYTNYPIITDSYIRGLLFIRNPFTDEVQLTEVVSLTKNNDTYTMQKAQVFDGEESRGELKLVSIGNAQYEYRFIPTIPDSFDYDSKLYTNIFTKNNDSPENIGYVTLSGEVTTIQPSQTQRVYIAATNNIESVVLHAQLIDASGTSYYYEVYAFKLGSNTYSAVYSFDGTPTTTYNNPIGEFNVELDGGRIEIELLNNSSSAISYSSKHIEFRPTNIGNNPYRFRSSIIGPGDERSLNLISNRVTGSTSNSEIDVLTLDPVLFQGAKVVISINGSSVGAVHQVMMVNNVSSDSSYNTTYPFITEGDGVGGSGIGTFGTELTAGDWTLKFYPDAGVTETITLTAYAEAFYRTYDTLNYSPEPLIFQENEEKYVLAAYVAPNGLRSNSVRFPLKYRGTPIFEKTFNPADTINQSDNFFTINNHFFSPGEEVYYESGDTVDPTRASDIEISPVTIDGVVYNTMPPTVYVIKLDLRRFGVAATQQDALNFNYINIIGNGSGNQHTFGMRKKIEKGLFTIDGIVQAPLAQANLEYTLDETLDFEDEFIPLTGIGTIGAGDLLYVDEEYVLIEDVGFATSKDGPITNTGSIPLVRAERGVVGSIATSHTNGSPMFLYRGNYNIVESDIVFTEAPNGKGNQVINENNLVELNSTFQGRVFLQQEYDQIRVYDDLSDQFDGIQNRFNVTANNIATTGIENGGGVLIINDIYQTPTTENNQGNNYFFTDAEQSFNFIWSTNTGLNPGAGVFEFNASTTRMVFNNVDADGINRETYWATLNVGSRYTVTVFDGTTELFSFEGENTDPLGPTPEIRLDNGSLVTGALPDPLLEGKTLSLRVSPVNPQTQVVFTGVSSSNGQRVESEFDINQNQIPRGGLIVSLGSTPGLGYAPLVNAIIDPIVSGGVIIGVNTENTIGNTTPVRWADYNNESGELVITTYGAALTGLQAITDAQYFEDAGRLVITTSANLTSLGVSKGDIAVLSGLNFECSSGGAPSQQIFPDRDSAFVIESIISTNVFSVTVGVSTIAHTYVSGGTFQTRESFDFNDRGGFSPQYVYLDNLEFECPSGQTQGLNSTIFPVDNEFVPVVFRDDAAHIRLNVGISTLVHNYVGGGTIGQYKFNNVGSGYNKTVAVAVTETGHTGAAASIVAIPGPGGELTFNIIDGGSGYSDPYINVPSPTYFNLPVKGVFRRDLGFTEATGENLFVTCEVGGATTTAIGRSEYFEVKNWEISNQGYGFQEGDIITTVGLVTDKRLSQPIEEFQLTVVKTFTDNFAYWNYGEQDYIDSIKNLQDGVRKRFPLIYNGQQFSFEQTQGDEDSSAVDLDAILLIYVNNVLQEPGRNYSFEGGTSFEFTSAPFPDDDIDIYFYRGKRNVDSRIVTDISESVRPGDELQIKKNDTLVGSKTQDLRTVTEIASSDTVRTSIYFGDDDIDDVNPRQVAWDKQKRDIFIYGQPTYKTRDSLEPQIRPTAAIIQPVLGGAITNNDIWVDNPLLFTYESDALGSDEVLTSINFRIYGQENIFRDKTPNPGVSADIFEPAEVVANVNGAGEVSLSVLDSGKGYPNGTEVSIGPPPASSPDGKRAFANVTVNSFDGSLNINVPFVGRGDGYDPSNPPTVIVQEPSIRYEKVVSANADNIRGFVGTVIGIRGGSISGQNNITFTVRKEFPGTALLPNETVNGDYFVINQTSVGNGVQALGSPFSPSNIGIGTQFLDSVYRIRTKNDITGSVVEITADIRENYGSINIPADEANDLGKFSFGVLQGVIRDVDDVKRFIAWDPTYTEDMENFPTIVRRSAGLRDRGPISKQV